MTGVRHNNSLIDNNAESSVEKRIPYLTTISPHAGVNNNDDPPKKYGHFSTLLYNELKKHNLYENSPRYLESQTFDDMEECDHHLAREMRKNNDTYENEYTLLNTDKWTVPMTKPKLCIATSNLDPLPTNEPGYPLNLKEWDNSRKISNTYINKKWANDQVDSSK